MAKEMVIIFVYDTQLLRREEDDDPSSAILYFHPSWVSDQQKAALCGQLIGTIHCVKTIFSTIKIVSLQSGKFYIKEYGRYLMAVGTDRNIADWLLEHRANIMTSLITFFHQDIEIMSKSYDNPSKLSSKLYQLFETYLKYMFSGGSIFSYIPSIKLPKSASNVFLEALQILQCCQELNNVLGGTLLYHNKVVATQLSSNLNKCIVLTDPYRIKCPSEIPQIDFDLPLGVQLLEVYITSKDYHKLHTEATKNRNVFQYLSNKSLKRLQTKSVPAKEPVISAMKRDQSLIFTTVPEEECDHHPVVISEKKSQNRPKFLNLKSKTTDLTINAKSTGKAVATTPFNGQTSVCSTPMTELNRIIHAKPMSICLNSENYNTETCEKCQVISKFDNNNSKFEELLTSLPYSKIGRNLHDSKKYSSVFDVREKLTSIDKSITMKYYNRNCLKEETNETNKVFKTIADPNYPIFRSDGTVVSHPFYEDYITSQIELISTELEDSELPVDKNPFDDFDSNLDDFVKSVSLNVDDNTSSKGIEMSLKTISKQQRKSLTLPLKSLNITETSQAVAPSPMRRHSSGVLLTPLMSRLSSFTFEDRSSGFCSHDTSPSEFRCFTPTQANFPYSFNKKQKTKLNNESNDDSLQKCILFVCGQQDMVVSLLLQEEKCPSQELIRKLWEICTDNLGKLEKQLRHCLETYPSSQNIQNDEPYSYLYLDADWDTTHRGGPWGSTELGALTYFHRDFKEYTNLTEILMRCVDGVIYGYRCGTSEIFYHQTANSNAGLPTPADPMGNIPLKAKRRLERDHSIIIL